MADELKARVGDPNAQFAELKTALEDQITATFPIRDKGGKFEIRVRDVSTQDPFGVDDIKSQYKARVEGRSWVAPVTGTVDVIDLQTGKVLASRKQRIADIPKMTRHYSWIIGGKEMSLQNQWRLRPGAYVKATERDGEYEAQFQLAKGKSFDIQQEEKGGLFMKMGTRKIPLYNVLKSQGVSDEQMKHAWGGDAFAATKGKAKDKDLQSMYEAWKGSAGGADTDYHAAIGELMKATQLDPEIAHQNLGVRSPHVTGEMMLAASKKLIHVAAGDVPADSIDSLRYKELWGPKDHMVERLQRSGQEITLKVQSALRKPTIQQRLRDGDASALRDVISPDLIRRPLYYPFTAPALSSTSKQTNPLSMLADRSATTIMGPGGIKNTHMLNSSNTAIDPSHLGYLDPVFTPESNPGVTTHLSFGTKSTADRKPITRLFNVRTQKYEDVDAATAATRVVVLPDQVTWKNDKPAPRIERFRSIDGKGELRDDLKWAQVDYVMPSTSQVFALETNLVPFMGNDSAGRTTMSARHMAQAISVVGREPPMVRVEASPGQTFEGLIGGNFLAHKSPVAGVVLKVRPGEITIKDGKGQTHSVHTYDHYPTNDTKGMLHSTPLVKAGQMVKANQLVADNNFTRDGQLALGTNLRVAYLSNGFNHEDGVVLSESAAKKLASEHLYKPNLYAADNTITGKKQFINSKAGVYTPARLEQVDDEGIVRVGAKVKPGDPLVLALNETKAPTGITADSLNRLGKKLRNPLTNASIVWDAPYEGEVVAVHRNGRNTTVHIKTLEPAQVGSKISTRHSAKGIIAQVLSDDEMPVNEHGKPMEMLLNPACYDEQTEFLTQRGWLRGSELKITDTFGTLNPTTLAMEWQEAVELQQYAYKGKMYRIENQQLDLLVTPNHRMFTAPRKKGPGGTVGNFDFGTVNPSHFSVELAEDIVGLPRRYLKAGKWEGHDPEVFAIAAGERVSHAKPRDGFTITSMQWAEFMGWYLSEGHVHLGAGSSYTIGISQALVNPEKRDRIRELLAEMELTATEVDSGFVIRHKGLFELLGQLGKARDKYIPREILDLPPKHLEVFLAAYIAGDGNVRWEPDEGRYGTRRVSTNSRWLADGLQEVCLKLGFAANVKLDPRVEKYVGGEHFTLSLGPRCAAPWVNWCDVTKANQQEGWIDYDGVVYCCTVPNSLLFVRRNGKAVVSGNSVPGRNNPGQILETVAGRIAEKTGKPYVVKNFQGGTNYLKKIEGELKQHGLKDTDTLYDPKTGRRLGEVMAGPHYVFQLEHQIDKKTHVRSGGPPLTQSEAPRLYYDADTKIPRGGGHHGAQSLGSLGISAALASGLHDNLREMQTLKSDQPQAHEVWAALTNGDRLPPPKIPFAYKRFEAMLQGLGVNLEKTGTTVRMMPRTDAETRLLSRGALARPTRGLRGKDDAPEPGGIFDPTITGGPGPSGQHWSHIELETSLPHPVYAKPIALALGIKEADIPEILAGKKDLNGVTGPKAFTEALGALNVDAELKKLQAKLADPKTRETALNKANSQYKAMRVLQETGKHPKDAWMLKAVPVLPPVYRPAATMPDGSFRSSPLNSLYRRVAMVNDTLQRGTSAGVPWDSNLDTTAGLYGELGNLFGTVPKGKKALDLDMRGTKEDRNKKLPGIIHMIAGESPKDGFFQDKLIGKKQDYTARATIVGDPNLSVDELGVPRKLAAELMRPMVVARLVRMGKTPVQANLMVSRHDPLAHAALEEEVKHRPILMKRDPVLHQYGLVGQNIKLIDSAAIKVSPLVLPPLGGDIDGDTVSLYVPLSAKSIEEVKRVVPSARTISDSSGDVLYSPSNESALALHRTTLNRKKSAAVFQTHDDAEAAFKTNKIDLDSGIHIKGTGDTTLGRSRISKLVPDRYKRDIATNLEKPFDRTYQAALLKDVAKNEPKHFVALADNLSRLGFQMAYESGHTVALKDIQPLTKERDAIVAVAQKKVDTLNRAGRGDETKAVWLDATKDLHAAYGEHHKLHPTDVSDMALAGIKAKREQFQGLIMAPMLVENHKGEAGKVPITTSFAEGIDVGGYFVQASGARRGVIQKVDAVREPGYMSKLLVRATIDQPITARDCGTAQGISLGVKTRDNRDLVDRYLAQETKLGAVTHASGAVVTPEMLADAAKEGVGKLVVRSPLKCRMPQGVCSVCMGVHPSGHHWEVGEHAGLISAQALGERAAQLMLKQTHGGGIVSTSPHTVKDFEDVQRLFNASQRSREDAIVAHKDGQVTRVEKTPQGSWSVHVGTKAFFSRQKPLPATRVGAEVRRGDVLTSGEPNIHDVLATQGHDAAQNYMTQRIGDIYGREGVLRRHTELAVRNSMGTVRITDPGDHGAVIRDDYMMKNAVDELNRVQPNKAPIKYEAVLSPIKSVSIDRQRDWMARLGSENLAKTIVQAAQHGETSHFDSLHPLPALAQGANYNLLPKTAR